MVYSKKLDKIDKLVISLTFIIVTFVCIFNTFCNASERLDFIVEENKAVSRDKIIYSESQDIYYIKLKKGHTYKLTNNYKYEYNLYFSDSLDIGSTVDQAYSSVNLPYNNTVDFYAENEIILTFFPSQPLNSYFIIEDITPSGLPTAISDLVGTFGFGFFDNILVNLIPYISVVILFSLGVWFIKHNIIEHSKGREY